MSGESASAPQPSLPPGDVVSLLLKEQLLTDAHVRHAKRVQGKLETPRSLVTVLQDLQIVSADQIRQAVRANPQSMRLGDLLIDLGHLRESDLRAALAAQQAAGGKKRLGEILVESRVMSEHRLTEVPAIGDDLTIGQLGGMNSHRRPAERRAPLAHRAGVGCGREGLEADHHAHVPRHGRDA